MQEIITYNSKRYEITDYDPIVGCLMIQESGDIIRTSSLPHIETLIENGARMLQEIPLYPTQSGIALEIDRKVRIKYFKNRMRIIKEITSYQKH